MSPSIPPISVTRRWRMAASSPLSAQGLVRALGGSWHHGHGMARCPAHADRTPSLSISSGRDSGLLVHCHGGCGQDVVISELRRRGLWPDRGRLGPEPEALLRIVGDRRPYLRSAEQLAKARALWGRRQPIERSPAELYLRKVRRIGCPLPATIGYLPSTRPDRHPAMIAAFGLAQEPEPGLLDITETHLTGIHLTLLQPDGRGKADAKPNKIMVGASMGCPIVLAPMNDALGLVICEGIETGLSLAEATGLGVWAAGAAGRMPALAARVPAWVDCVTIAGEDDPAGRKGALGLAKGLRARGLLVELRFLGRPGAIAA